VVYLEVDVNKMARVSYWHGAMGSSRLAQLFYSVRYLLFDIWHLVE
jgi:hypothetical protein